MRRTLPLAIVVFTAILLQTTAFTQVTLAGAKPELIYLVTILAALLEGPATGAIVGFAGGMAQDFLLNQPKGITALVLTLLGNFVGQARTYIVTPSPWLPVLLVGLGTFGGVIFYTMVDFILGQLDVSWAYAIRTAILSGLYNALLTPVVYPIMRRVCEDRSMSLFRR
jgi:rod shape-determining protein MreD